MQLVRYSICGVELAMIDVDGELYCSMPQLAEALNATRQQLGQIARAHSDELEPVRLSELTDMIHTRKEMANELGLVRARTDTRLWSESDVLLFCMVMRTDVAKEARREFKEILKQHARRGMYTAAEVEALRVGYEEILALKNAFEAKCDLYEGKFKRAVSNAGELLSSARYMGHPIQ